MGAAETSPAKMLAFEFKKRQQKNARFSLRAFAKLLGVAPSTLSMVLSGTRGLSRRMALQVASRLNFDAAKKEAFLRSCALNRLQLYELAPEKHVSHKTFQHLDLEKYRVIAHWYHYAIFSLIDTVDFQPQEAWIAHRLNISLREAKEAVKRLKKLGLLETSGKEWKQTTAPLKVDSEKSTKFTKMSHKRILNKAKESLMKDPPDARSFSAVTLALDPAMMAVAKTEITKFRRRLMHLLEAKSKEPSEVYHLAVQLYPVTKLKGSK